MIKARLSNLRSGGSTTFMANFILSTLAAFALGLFVASAITEYRAKRDYDHAGALTGVWSFYIILAVFLIKLGIFLA